MKNKIVFLFAFLFFSFLPLNAYSEKISSEQLADKLPKIENRECKFRQEKVLKNLQKPLVSNGNFKLVKGEGVYYETLYPVKSTVSYTNRDYKQINDIILAVSNKKYSKLDREFDLFYIGNKNMWTLKLEPKEVSRAYKYLDFILLKGSDKIDQIVIVTKDESKTTQWFSEE